MSQFVSDGFVTKFTKLGTDKNHEFSNGEVKTWEHFYLELPQRFVTQSHKSIPEIKRQLRDSKNVFRRALNEISQNAVQTVLDLIAENSLYRGEEWRGPLEKFAALQQEYATLDEKHG